jgi:hypothetical protein
LRRAHLLHLRVLATNGVAKGVSTETVLGMHVRLHTSAYSDQSCKCMRPYATSVRGLTLLVHEA